MFDDDTGIIGRRIREIRSDRQMTLRQVAELAGFSPSYVSRLETGRRAVDKRKVLEPLAYALRVSPVDLTRDERDHGAGMGGRRAHTALVPLEAALEIDLGDDPDVPARPWPEIAADIDRLQHLQHGLSDYNGQLELLPTLIPELHAALQQQPRYRNNILLALLHTYSSTMWSSKRLGAAGMPGLASRHAERMAAELDQPEWIAYAAWLRGDATGAVTRTKQYRRSVSVAEQLVPHLDHLGDAQQSVRQAFGMLHLSAALAAAAGGDHDTAHTHLAEADQAAAKLDTEVGGWAHLWFGRINVGIWKASLAAEAGDSARVAALADQVPVKIIPSPSRRAEFRMETGRVLLDSKRTRDKGLRFLTLAHQEAPQRVANDPFTREVIANRMRTERREAGSRELRYLAHAVGLGPSGRR